MGYNRQLINMKKFNIIVLLSLIITACGSGSIESQNDKHIRNMERALERGDIQTVGQEMKYLDEYDDRGGRFTEQQEAKFEEMERKYPESLRQGHHEKDRLQGK